LCIFQLDAFDFPYGPTDDHKPTSSHDAIEVKNNIESSVTLEGVQVIGYTCNALPLYPNNANQ